MATSKDEATGKGCGVFLVFIGVCWVISKVQGCVGGTVQPTEPLPPAVTLQAEQRQQDSEAKKSEPTAVTAPAKATLVRYRLVPFRTAQGKDTSMLMVDWKNTGTVPIRVVKADIDVFDAAGKRLASSAKDHHIYIVARDQPGVQPGQTFRRKQGEGYVLLSFDGVPAKVKVRITSASVRANNI